MEDTPVSEAMTLVRLAVTAVISTPSRCAPILELPGSSGGGCGAAPWGYTVSGAPIRDMRVSAAKIAVGLALLLLWIFFYFSGVSAPQLSYAAIQRPAPPRQIRIGAVIYTIEMVEKVPPAGDASGLAGKACDESAVRNGWCDAKDRIYLEIRRPLQQERTTLLHEIQHVILGTEKSEEETSYHDFIYKLSPKLLQVLQDNPELYFYLTAPAPN